MPGVPLIDDEAGLRINTAPEAEPTIRGQHRPARNARHQASPYPRRRRHTDLLLLGFRSAELALITGRAKAAEGGFGEPFSEMALNPNNYSIYYGFIFVFAQSLKTFSPFSPCGRRCPEGAVEG
jgi:hypothetical protein